MGYNLLVFASSIKRLAFVSFVLGYYAHGQRLVGYLEDKNPWVDRVPHFFLRSDASRHPVGYICWDFLFYVVVGFIGVGRNGKTLSTTFTNLTRPSVEKWTLAIHYLHGWTTTKGGLATSVMSPRLPYCSARDEESKKKKKLLLLSKSRLWRGIEGKICDLLSCKTADSSSNSTRDAMWSIGSSPILQTGAEDALHCVVERKDAGHEAVLQEEIHTKVINN